MDKEIRSYLCTDEAWDEKYPKCEVMAGSAEGALKTHFRMQVDLFVTEEKIDPWLYDRYSKGVLCWTWDEHGNKVERFFDVDVRASDIADGEHD